MARGASTSRTAVQIAIPAVCILAAVGYAWCATRLYLSHRLAARREQPSLHQAIAFEPRNAENYDLLGQSLLVDSQDPEAASRAFRQATSLNPYSSTYWLHLARASSSLGSIPEQAHAIERAVAVDPTTPDVAWYAANFDLIQGDNSDALRQLSVVLRSDPTMVGAALELCWRAVGNVDQIAAVLPPDPQVHFEFLKLLTERKQWEGAQRVWTGLLQSGSGFDHRAALFYVDALIGKPDFSGAQQVWQDLMSRSADLAKYQSPDNLIVDGTFSHEILNAGFDWHYAPQPGISVMVDSTQSHRGSQSLLITYSNTGDDSGMFQYIPVEPSSSYTLSAWVKSEELESANGPLVEVSDAYTHDPLVRTEGILGTTPWHQQVGHFTTAPQTRLVLLKVTRIPGTTRIQGRFWIDDVVLRPGAGQP